ncbi:MAG: bifunctional 5,10-methylene-tetrahydrofolate dehydrogenase/5,10-methylene-tetrahydrofolate cyclohydrolase [Candidatus Puniceispirillum sp.]|nr:bifunctional 5,10-methylene-tetrahydrofolate dehydrogenase/5,10-methylene-tetrahydrofolate cyclohydrolase [Candidatus Pelagibacter sp.]MBA4283048.1 bifunctional 5,10-methylene-tetrahydrofolate dehydrogenase/5,10-methylene-tetrahydrofolate cyclohydrolase [Candidatus Puniceispirillum sp.]
MILKGRDIAQAQIPLLRQTAQNIQNQLQIPVTLHIVSVGDDPASQVYISMKKRKGSEVGIHVEVHQLDKDTDQKNIEMLIAHLNQDPHAHGIIVQLPLPSQINKDTILNMIHPLKDVDGLSATSQGLLIQQNPTLVPCTPLGCLHLIKEVYPDVSGKTVTIVGRSCLVGLPLSLLLIQENATVTLCHSKTIDLKKHTLSSDIIVMACGTPHLLTEDMVSQNAVVIDVGISRLPSGEIVGDADFENLYQRVNVITPVPGGVGPMTVLYLLHNTLKAAILQNNLSNISTIK